MPLPGHYHASSWTEQGKLISTNLKTSVQQHNSDQERAAMDVETIMKDKSLVILICIIAWPFYLPSTEKW